MIEISLGQRLHELREPVKIERFVEKEFKTPLRIENADLRTNPPA
jgi:hypothetical protein